MPPAGVEGKHAARILLGYVMEARLAGAAAPAGACTASPWDAWWACYRAGLPSGRIAVPVIGPAGACPACTARARRLAAADPPGHPGADAGACGCLLRWAAMVRGPGTAVAWPPMPLSLALIKPGAPAPLITRLLKETYEVLASRQLVLTAADTRRMYPEAYGAEYVAARDAYLTSGPVQVLTLLARDPGGASSVKAQIRADTGADALRNHLHMPDNPGEAMADIAHLAGYPVLHELYRRYERDYTDPRMAFYRAALGLRPAGADRLPATR